MPSLWFVFRVIPLAAEGIYYQALAGMKADMSGARTLPQQQQPSKAGTTAAKQGHQQAEQQQQGQQQGPAAQQAHATERQQQQQQQQQGAAAPAAGVSQLVAAEAEKQLLGRGSSIHPAAAAARWGPSWPVLSRGCCRQQRQRQRGQAEAGHVC